ncbi:N-acetyltransferase [Reticulibacter mediterranei]|uniref:N-acetyltransferase n=1 Tax=Reticulibacter mediterranei TaxID=2778369 RepID=A0A8J3MZ91_9CHLR|nr:GNAT family protein [Reticulibacter mediterranei]GHO91657.1 N-acetyltransferase [Reticulibacter mediterranei]
MNIFLDSDNIYLRTLERDDLDLFWQWFADREITRYSMGMLIFPFSKAETQEWLERTLHDKQVLSLGIVEKTSDQLLGYAGVTSISNINRSGEYYIFIGNKGSWGKGYGTEVTRLIVNYGFRSLNLHRIMLTVFAGNSAAIRVYTKAGFTEEGVMRQANYREGRYHDVIVMSILRPEWEQMQEIV